MSRITHLFSLLLMSLLLLAPIAHAETTASVTVPANAADFSAVLTSDTVGDVGKGQAMTYTLTYGSEIPTTTSITLTASWTLGTLAEDSTPTVDVLSYVPGSATDAYGGSTPIVDTVNRTITWDIPSMPGHRTGQIVSFQLKTSESYTTPGSVSFNTSGHLSGSGFTTTDSTVSNTLQIAASSGSSSSNSSGTSNSSTAQESPVISGVTISSLSDTSATIHVTTSHNAAISLHYGMSPTNLDQINTDTNQTTMHDFVIDGLKPQTTYYFSVTIPGLTTSNTTIYTFTTSSAPSHINISESTLTSGTTIIQPSENTYLLPTDSSYTLHLLLSESPRLTSGVLQGGDTLTPMTEVSQRAYEGTLETGNTPGLYPLAATMTDQNGNITKFPLGYIRVSEPIHILDKSSRRPIEHARVEIFLKNPETGGYSLLHDVHASAPLVLYSEPDGSVHIVLPRGDFRSITTAFGYERNITTFSLTNANATYPTIFLTRATPGIMTTITYYKDALVDIITTFFHGLQDIARSNRSMGLIAIVSLIIALSLLLTSLAFRMHLPLHALPLLLIHTLVKPFLPGHEKALRVRVTDTTGEPIPGVHVYGSDPHSHHILARNVTNLMGETRLLLPAESKYELHLVKRGFKTKTIQTTGDVTVILLAEDGMINSAFETSIRVVSEVLGSLFEGFLMLTILLEVFYGLTYGLSLVAPFIFASLLSLWLWIAHRIALRRHIT